MRCDVGLIKNGPYGVSICAMTQIFRGKISRKIRDFFINPPNFSGNFAPKNSGHDADWDTIRRTGSPEIEKIDFLQIFQLFITKFLLSYLLKLKGFFGYLKSSPLLAFEVVFEEGSWSWWPPLGSRVRVDFDGSLVVQAWSRLACFWSRVAEIDDLPREAGLQDDEGLDTCWSPEIKF